MQSKIFNIVAISGSLKKASTNTGLLRACIASKNPALNIEILDISNFPLFNEDVEKQGTPAVVKAACEKVRAADAIILANPENNHCVSAPLKNAYDWLSRGGENAAVFKKPMAQLGTGVRGAVLAAEHLKNVVKYCKVELMEEPKVNVARYEPGNFNQKGDSINPKVNQEISNFLEEYVVFLKNREK